MPIRVKHDGPRGPKCGDQMWSTYNFFRIRGICSTNWFQVQNGAVSAKSSGVGDASRIGLVLRGIGSFTPLTLKTKLLRGCFRWFFLWQQERIHSWMAMVLKCEEEEDEVLSLSLTLDPLFHHPPPPLVSSVSHPTMKMK